MNLIALRVQDFLKLFPPFNQLSDVELSLISHSVKVVYLDKNKILFKEGDTPHEFFYIIKEGKILLKKEETSKSTTIDLCDEGELFGIRPLLAKDKYLMTAIAEEESVVYGISIDVFTPILNSNTQVAVYLIKSFASKTKNPYYSEYLSKIYLENQFVRQEAIDDLQKVRYRKNTLTCSKTCQISLAAVMMTENKTNTVIVVTNTNKPIGIITDKDLRQKVATGKTPIDAPVSDIMSSPVRTFRPKMSIAQAQLLMLKYEVSHLCITADGTVDSVLEGVITEQDLIVSKASTAPVLVKAIKRAHKSKELKKIRFKVKNLIKNYISNNIPMTLIFGIIHQINESITQKVIEISISKMKAPPPCKFAWLSLGSHGRAEQFLTTDQDNAIVFEDVPKEDYQKVKHYFLKLAKHINKRLQIIGYQYCPADMMARNPNWCLSLSQWDDNFRHWIVDNHNEDILLCSIFFDFNCSYGDKNLAEKLSDKILKYVRINETFFKKLAKNIIETPSPLGFFKQFLVEQNGEHKKSFDLKSRALMPFVDIGRLLILSSFQKNINSTANRYERMAKLEPQNKELYLSASYAVKALLKFRTKYGIIHNDSGRYIKLDDLSKEERLKLKRCFKVLIRMQEIIKIRFRLV